MTSKTASNTKQRNATKELSAEERQEIKTKLEADFPGMTIVLPKEISEIKTSNPADLCTAVNAFSGITDKLTAYFSSNYSYSALTNHMKNMGCVKLDGIWYASKADIPTEAPKEKNINSSTPDNDFIYIYPSLITKANIKKTVYFRTDTMAEFDKIIKALEDSMTFADLIDYAVQRLIYDFQNGKMDYLRKHRNRYEE